jgi:integrase
MPRRNLSQKLARTGEKRASKSTFTRRQSNYLTCLRAKRLSACLQLLKEIPIRIGEALSLKWTETDSERRIIYVNTTEKDGKKESSKSPKNY